MSNESSSYTATVQQRTPKPKYKRPQPPSSTTPYIFPPLPDGADIKKHNYLFGWPIHLTDMTHLAKAAHVKPLFSAGHRPCDGLKYLMDSSGNKWLFYANGVAKPGDDNLVAAEDWNGQFRPGEVPNRMVTIFDTVRLYASRRWPTVEQVERISVLLGQEPVWYRDYLTKDQFYTYDP
ncbi:hypothetical protein AMATHDRAFT_11563 [Amanita thiersii Skay4041]|uniref:Uncharacterized protein n=1 Tax=Amanita thiersii Skay4041 TaxID=703135 RepID=A0A2A9N9X2_9AGAR|nr:hypothetical protein AMATHDRAFT_11563 [Amanita thiersii Skay4041]